MKLDLKTLNALIDSEFYVGIDAYLIGDDKKQIPYHIYMCVTLSDNVAVIITKPLENQTDKYELYEFNGNKIFEHGSTRIKMLDETKPMYTKILNGFNNKEFVRK